MVKRPKRQKAIKRLNLSDHTLDINIRKCNYNNFNFSEIEEHVRELVGSRDYQYDAIKQVMIYLWGGIPQRKPCSWRSFMGGLSWRETSH
jgi:hypothetical protein